MALFPRVTTWVSNQILTAAALNGEFNNILNNAQISSMVGYSANVAQMQQQTSPGGVGTESLAGSGSDEVQRLRFMLAYTLGKSYWYDQTGSNLGPLGIKAGAFAAKAIATGDIADAAVTPVKLGAFNYAASAALTTTQGFGTVTVATVSLTVSGTRPVYVELYGGTLFANFASNSTSLNGTFTLSGSLSSPTLRLGGSVQLLSSEANPTFQINVGVTATYQVSGDVSINGATASATRTGSQIQIGAGGLNYMEIPGAAGTYTYTFLMAGSSNNVTVGCNNTYLIAYEG